MAREGDDKLPVHATVTRWDKEEWEWK
jgi:hypothetical protein